MTYRLHHYTKARQNERPLTFAVRILSHQWNYPSGSVLDAFLPANPTSEAVFVAFISAEFPFGSVLGSSTLRRLLQEISQEESFEKQKQTADSQGERFGDRAEDNSVESNFLASGGSFRIIPREERFESQMKGLIRLEKKTRVTGQGCFV